MRILAALFLLIISAGIVRADILQNTNPFPTQIRQEELTNIYATDPAVMQKEQRTEKKMGWWNKKNNSAKNSEQPTETENNKVNEGIQDGSFYVFPAK